MKDVAVFHAGTTRKGRAMVTDGGRVLGVTALGEYGRGRHRHAPTRPWARSAGRAPASARTSAARPSSAWARPRRSASSWAATRTCPSWRRPRPC
ncbi:MAG: hypothetical protein MZV70_13070 [Desulfobacterales bacterium]|nr:hypothetical protein [Desulfobacterales bacterium]